MEFGDVWPQEKAGAAYFRDAFALAEETDGLGFTHIHIDKAAAAAESA
jgi:hypothetical protein